MSEMKRVVVCSAIRIRSTGQLVCGPRHSDCIRTAYDLGLRTIDDQYVLPYDQGFVDQFNEYLTRQEAWEVASAAGQIVRRCGGDDGVLFSENLY